MNEKFIDGLLDKYWGGKTSIEEERLLKSYFTGGESAEKHEKYKTIFDFFQVESTIAFRGSLTVKKKKLLSLKMNWQKIAASIILLLGLSFLIFNSIEKDRVAGEDKWAKHEIKDPEKAREAALEALAFLSVKLKKGEDNVKESFKPVKKLPFH